MKNKKKLDKILESSRLRIQEEVGALMGVDFILSDFSGEIISQKDYFASLAGKNIVAKMDITGEVEGLGALVLSIKDAIRLGGTLIMLPQAELEEVISNEEYTDESEDSYGEIANIISGSVTKSFEEMYPQNCRFIRKEQVIVDSRKGDIEADELVPDQWYYLVRGGMSLNDKEMGDLDFLIPAKCFDLEVPQDASEALIDQAQTAVDEKVEESISQETENIEETAKTATAEQTEKNQEIVTPQVDRSKQKKLVEKLLENCRKNISEEVGALLGVDVSLNANDNRIITKEDFFLEEAEGKQVLARLDAVDEVDEKCFFFASLKDAIKIGSILIMLPPSEAEIAIAEEEFTIDTEDSYGEIVNIISGVYTTVFQEQYTENIRFIKNELEVVAPLKVDVDTDDVIPHQSYYMNSCILEIDGKAHGNIVMLFPAALLKLDEPVLEEATSESVGSSVSEATNISSASNQGIATGSASGSINTQGVSGGDSTDAEILLIGDNGEEVEKIKNEISRFGIGYKAITYGDSIDLHINPNLKLVFIVMTEVNEQAYGITIKVNSICNAPIVAAGPEWTRSKVIKAVKYGVDDILLTPALDSDIKEKIDSNMRALAA